VLAGFLMCGVAGAALAAPRGPDPRDAKIQMMEQQLQQMNAELTQLRASGGTSDEKLSAIQAQMDAFAKDMAELKGASDAATADILTLKAPPAGNAVTPTLGNGKPTFATTDGRFTANVKSVMQFDAAYYNQNAVGPVNTDFRRSGSGSGAEAAHARQLNSGTTFRRARFGVDGKVFGDFEYAAIYEFGGSGGEDGGHIHELWMQYSALKPFHIKVGAYEPIIGLQASASTGSLLMMERPDAAEVSRNVAAGDSRSALQIWGNGDIGGGGDTGIGAYWLASAALTGNTVGTINSTGGATAQPFGEQYAVIGRAAIAPFSGNDWLVHLGVHGQYVMKPNNSGPSANGITAAKQYSAQFRDRPESRVDATRLVDTGSIDAKHVTEAAVEAGAQYHNFFVESEYFRYGVNRYVNPTNLPDPSFHGWYVEGSWILTGENRRYNRASGAFDGPAVNAPFNLSAGTWGAFELAARYSDLNLNYHQGLLGTAATADAIRGGEQKILTVGMNWYLNPTIRFMLNYQHVKVNRLAPTADFGSATGTLPVGSQIGQTFDTIALRSQLQF